MKVFLAKYKREVHKLCHYLINRVAGQKVRQDIIQAGCRSRPFLFFGVCTVVIGMKGLKSHPAAFAYDNSPVRLRQPQ